MILRRCLSLITNSSLLPCANVVVLLIIALLTGCSARSTPLMGPEIMGFHSYPQFMVLLHPLHTNIIVRDVGLPAPQGTDFEGPDPGLNAGAAIINVGEICPNNYMKDIGGKCRPAFTYGPNPLRTFTPEKFKGSIRYYMRIGQRRRNHLRPNNGRLKNGKKGPRNKKNPLRNSPPVVVNPGQLAPSPQSIIPTAPPLTESVSEIAAILGAVQSGSQSTSTTPSTTTSPTTTSFTTTSPTTTFLPEIITQNVDDDDD